MKLVIEADHKAGIIFDDPDDMTIDAGFLVRASAGNEEILKKLKAGNRFYFYIDDAGDIGNIGGVFKNDPIDNEVTSQASFKDAAPLLFSLEPKRSMLGTTVQQEMHRESMLLKGSRLSPSYMDIKKVQLDESTLGGKDIPYAYITGRIHRMQDPRLVFSSPEEKTRFGSGQFDIKNVKALHNGNFIHLVLSPYATQIEKVVEEQKDAFRHYSELYSDATADPDTKEAFVSKYEHTRKLLRPHAHEIYKYQNGMIYYISRDGNWQSESLYGLRDLDLDDRLRIQSHLLANNEMDDNLADRRQSLFQKPIQEQKRLENISAALQPAVKDSLKKDTDDFERRQKKTETLRPADGPLGANDLPGLKKEVVLFPHQAMVLASLKDRDRMLVDADPGAGKALIIICDILQQMKARKVMRPLVLMPESLLPQFAREVKEFSDLNPWIISTDSIKRWGSTGLLPEMLEDAKRSPRNTVFLTSYNWISLEPDMLDNGDITEDAGHIAYKKTKVFSRPLQLMKELKIDAVYQDECHILRKTSNMSRAAAQLANVPVFRGLTGTIMPGNPYDLTGPMSSIHSSVFGTKDDFMSTYTQGNLNKFHPDAPKMIRGKLKDFGVVSVRRSAWSHLLPKIHREYHYATFTPEQQKAYTALLTNILDDIRKDPKLSALLKRIEDALEDGDEISAGPLLTRFIPLDVFLNAPAEAKDWLKTLMVGDNAVGPKVKMINEIIHRHLANPDAGKVLVLVQYRESARNIFDHLDPDLKAKAAYFEGGMTEVLNQFKNPQDPLKILIGVDKSIVTGHNIQSANCIINADLKWLPGDMAQREARAARIGQSRDVYIHNILVKGSAEILKMAKLISAEHTISKANSDFTDNSALKPVQMTLPNMQGFTAEHQLNPYISRKKAIDANVATQSAKERDLYGPTMLKPHGYSNLTSIFREAKVLKKVPSAKEFVGNVKSHDDLVAQDLAELPTEPKHPKLLSLGLMQWNSDWYLFSYKTADPDGFLRRFGFTLFRGYYYLEISSKAAVDNVIKKVERSLTIINKPEFEQQVREARIMAPGARGGLGKESRKARIAAAASDMEKVENSPDFVDKSKVGEIELEFSVVDGLPVIFTKNTLSSGDIELTALRKVGFELEPAFWRKAITRSQLKQFFSKITEHYPQVRFSNWTEFKNVAHSVFKGLDLSEFDSLAEKKL